MSSFRIRFLLSFVLILASACVPKQSTINITATIKLTSPPSTLTLTNKATPIPTSTPSLTPSPTFPLVPTPTPNAEILIDNFEGRESPYPWSYSGDQGVFKSLSLGEGYTGKGLHLQYSCSKYPQVASVQLDLSHPVSATVIGFWIKTPPGVSLLLNAIDSSGQTLQYWPARPIDAKDPNSWYFLAIQLDAPDQWWSGANDGHVNGTIHKIVIGVTNILDPDMLGAIDIDDVVAIPTTSFLLDPSILPISPARSDSGNLSAILGVNLHSNDFSKENLEAAKSLGFSFVTSDLWWSMVESWPGTYDFSRFDIYLSMAEARGMKMHWGLDWRNRMYTGCDSCGPKTPAALQAFGRFAEAAAKHFAGHGVTYLVGGEPEIYFDASQYSNFLKVAIQSIRVDDPTATIIVAEPEDGSVTLWPFDELHAFLALGVPSGYDTIGHECYLFGSPPEHIADLELFYNSVVHETLPAIAPLWCTEVGYSSADYGKGDNIAALARHAVLVSRLLLSRWAEGYPSISLYELQDGSSNPLDHEGNFGLLAYNGTEKPAMQAVRTLMNIAKGRVFVGMIPVVPTSMHVLRMDGPQDTVLAVWLDTPGQQLSIEVPQGTLAMNFIGDQLLMEQHESSLVLTLLESNGPVFLAFPK
jgi:hypothetical protein